jgi:hypothetical protein
MPPSPVFTRAFYSLFGFGDPLPVISGILLLYGDLIPPGAAIVYLLTAFGASSSIFEVFYESFSESLISLVKVVLLMVPGLFLPAIVFVDIYVEVDLLSSISGSVYRNLSAISLDSSGAMEYLLLNANRVDLTDYIAFIVLDYLGTLAMA